MGFPRYSIVRRISVLIVMSQLILYASFSYMIFRAYETAVVSGEEEVFRSLEKTIHWSMDSMLAGAELAGLAIAEDQQVLELFALGKRARLEEYLRSLYEKIQGTINHIHFILPDGTSFLRMHASDRYGDTLHSRPMVKKALDSQASMSGVEYGTSALALRTIVPLIEDGTYLGSLELGMELGLPFIEALRDKQKGEYYLYFFNSQDSPVLLAGTNPEPVCPQAPGSMTRLFKGEADWSVDCTKARGVGSFPLRDFSGKVIGYIQVEIPRIPLVEAIKTTQQRLIYLGIFLALSLGISLLIAIQLLLAPLRLLVNQTKECSRRIMAGEESYHGRVHGNSVEFQDMIGAVNNIIIALRERWSLFQAIAEGIPGIVYYVDRDSRVLWANERARKAMSNPVGKVLGSDLAEFFDTEIQLLSQAFMRTTIQNRESCGCRGNDGGICWEHSAVPILGVDGEVCNIIRISNDITEKHRTEAELRRLNETLEKRVDEEISRRKEGERMADQQSRLAAIGELATGMAHEITQPLNAISFTVENIRARFDAGNLDAPYLQGKISAANADIDRVRRVIEHVRLFARGAPDGYRVRFSANRCVENALALMGVQLATHGIDTVLQLGEALPDLVGNPFQYEQVLLNLLSNARDSVEDRLVQDAHSDAADTFPGRISIGTVLRRDVLELWVEDNGVGISKDAESRAFNPFFTTKAAGRGTGLGLSISYGIIREMGGTMLLESREGGAIARVRVPISKLEA